jgi:sortase A
VNLNKRGRPWGTIRLVAQQTLARPPAEPRPRRRVLFWVGLTLVAAGLALLGYVGWQFFGTNIVSEHKQQQAVEQLQRQWRAGPTTINGSTADRQPVPIGAASALILIPRFGSHYVMPVFQGVGEDVLAKGFGHFADTAGPGQRGNYALAAHRITHGQPLREMPSLRPGDTVEVETRTHVYTYVLDTNPNDLIVDFTGTWVIAPHPVNPVVGGVEPSGSKRLITLTTCSELFHTDNRMIAFGHLVSSQPK